MAPADEADDDQHRLRVATCALLLEAAHADQRIQRRGTASRSRDIVRGRFDLDDDRGRRSAGPGRRRSASASGDLYQFARLINETFSRARKLAVVELLWQVVYSDGVLEAHEDALMHKLGNVLGVRHEELMALKIKVKTVAGLRVP